MTRTYDFDLVILGGGCAGLSLASHLCLLPGDLRFAIVEPRTIYQEDRTWCGWRLEPHLFDDCCHHSWERWRVVNGPRIVEKASAAYPYQMIRSDKFYQKAVELIHSNPRANLKLGSSVESLQESETGVNLGLAGGESWSTPWVVDTRPVQQELRAPWLWQNFVGYEVQSNRIFDSEGGQTPTLMDFQDCGQDVAQFMYVIPCSENSWLLEWTRFSRVKGQLESIEKDLRGWIDGRLGSDYTILRREAGELPMAPAAGSSSQRVISAGTRGGCMRASTGYAFHAIQRWAKECAQAISGQGLAIGPQRDWLLETMDECFLRVLQRDPVGSGALFARLFSACPSQCLIRFLAGRPRWRDFAEVVWSLPWEPFLRASLAMTRARLAR